VVQTRVGYAGGPTPHPTYRDIKQHAEVTRLIYSPAAIGLEQIIAAYFDRHRPRAGGGQYRSMLIATTPDQHAQLGTFEAVRHAADAVQRPTPDSAEAVFWDAEDYHQKYRLRRDKALVDALATDLGPAWDQAPLATKLNASVRAKLDVDAWLPHLSAPAQAAFKRAR
jgi:peptide-methionine (S)-S-oxide reductase